MADKKIGRVTHYYDKIGVAIVDLAGELKVGDTVVFKRGGEEAGKQVVESMQIERETITTAKKGDVVGMHVEDPVKEGTEVYK
jgi:putative protease